MPRTKNGVSWRLAVSWLRTENTKPEAVVSRDTGILQVVVSRETGVLQDVVSRDTGILYTEGCYVKGHKRGD